MKRKLLIGTLISGIFLYLALRDIDWSEFAIAFRRTNPWYLLPAVFFTMLGHFSRSYRWKFIIHPVKNVPLGPLWSATTIAFMVNNLFPARIGELARSYAIGKSQGVSKSAAFATVVYERVIDVFVLIVLLWLCLLRISGPDWLTRSGVILIVFNVVLLAMLFFMVRFREPFARIVERLTSPLPTLLRDRIRWMAEAFVDGLGVLTQVKALLPITILSIPVWVSAMLGVYYCLLALHIDVALMASAWLIVLISLGSMIPSAPAFIGTVQYACIVGLAVYGVEKSEALAYSTVYHATQFFPITLTGLYYAWRSHLRVSEISGGDTAASYSGPVG